jgi:GNAT superfamily N-acetyltransferase
MMDPLPLDGLVLEQLSETPASAHAAARRFCLEVIKEFYGFDYRRDWHEDLDSLCLQPDRNHYSRQSRGGFWTLSLADGTLLATAGIRGLHWKPNLVRAFRDRYPRPESVASLWRVYVRKDRRRHGLGQWLNRLSEDRARELGYETMYLHATASADATVAFWKASGYEFFAGDAETAHFDKPLAAVGRGR